MAAQRIKENLRPFTTDFLYANRFIVTKLACNPDGTTGFANSPAASARFDSPTSVGIA